MKPRFRCPLSFSVFIVLFLLGCLALPVSGKVFNVTETSDGTAESQLRGAIEAADLLGGGPHVINVAAGTYNLTLGSITFGNNQQNISIVGAGSASTIINMTATNRGRIFFINPPGTVANVVTSISGIKFTNGYCGDSFGGGAIISGGPSNAISISNCVFENNQTPAFGGGALSNMGGGTISVDQCVFTNNSAVLPPGEYDAGGGGAIRIAYYSSTIPVVGSASITNCTFTSNSVSASHYAWGGAVAVSAVYGSTSTSYAITIDKNAFVNNSVAYASNSVMGGAIAIASSFTTNIHYNTFSGNMISGSVNEALSVEQQYNGAVSATNNWWGCNTDPQSGGTCSERARLDGGFGGGSLTTLPQLVLKPAAGSTILCNPASTSTQVTASFLRNSSDTPMQLADLARVIGLPVSFTATNGSLSAAQTSIQTNGTATVNYTSAGNGSGSVNVLAGNLVASDAAGRVSITTSSAPGISTHPSSLTQCSGAASVNFSVAYNGGAPTAYKWYKADDLLSDNAKYAGTSTATLTVINPGVSDSGGEFKVEVSNACGSATSNKARLSLLGSRIYVAAGSTGDGSGWESPMGTLSEALDAARSCAAASEIWVKAGVYKPTTTPYGIVTPDPRNRAFYLINKVHIYGGFKGDETQLSQRQPGANQTILSGDIGEQGNIADNTYHVLVSVGNNSEAWLDGFVIRDGNANLVADAKIEGVAVYASNGGGAHISSSSPFINNCVFTANTAIVGGGMYIQGQLSYPLLNNCIFSGNVGREGGGIAVYEQSSANFVNCTIVGNSASNSGGAVFSSGSTLTAIENSLIWGNTASVSPGVTDPNGTVSLRYTLIQGGYGIPSHFNINEDPFFADASDPDGPDNLWMTVDDGLKPMSCSPAIDKGRNGYVAGNFDILFEIRIHMEVVDMGAYEFTSDKAAAPLAATGSTGTLTVLYGTTSVFLSSDCQVIASIYPNGDVDVKGSVEAKVAVEPEVIKVGNVAYVQRHYDILPANSPATSSARLTLFFTQADFDNYNIASSGGKLPAGPADASGKGSLIVIQYHGTSSTGLPGSYSGGRVIVKPDAEDIVWNAAFSRWEISFDVVGFSGFFIASDNALPVRLVSFKASISENTAQLRWSVADAEGFSHFEIEKSTDAHSFVKIGRVAFDQKESDYAFADPNIGTAIIYYRLKMLDLDGSFAYSRLEAVHVGQSAVLLVGYPNPFHRDLTIYSDQTQNAILTNGSGRKVMEIPLQKGNNPLEAARLTPGVYFLKTQNGDVLKLVRQ